MLCIDGEGIFPRSKERGDATELAVEGECPRQAVNSSCRAGEPVSVDCCDSRLLFQFGKFRTFYRGAGHKPFLAKDKPDNRLLEFQRA